MNSSSAAAAAAIMGHNVFVYGSLLADDVVRALLNRVPPSSAAILSDFRRFSIKGRVYPAILPVVNNNHRVSGRVLFGITDSELDVLDTFEDVEYQRSTVDVDVSFTDGSHKLQAYTYVWVDKDDPNLFGEWDFEEWRRTHMNDFLKMTVGFVEELKQPESKPRVATYESFYQQDEKSSC